MALSPFVVIGCGGAGGKVVVGLRKRLEEELDRRGWSDGIPAAWQLKWIDVPTQQERYPEFGPPLPARDYLGLAPTPYYREIDAVLMHLAAGHLSRFAGWRVSPYIDVPVMHGAGQMRAVGRSIALARAKDIANCVRGALDAVPTELERLGAHLRGTFASPLADDTNANLPLVVVVSSLAGGTGAGIFIDVCDLVRAVDPVLSSRIFGVLFTAEVLRDVKLNGGMPSNTVAALSELMSGALSVGRPSEPLYLDSPGVGGGPFTPYVIGLQPMGGEGAPLAGPAECYWAVTETLLATMLDEDLRQRFLSYDLVQFVHRVGIARRRTAFEMLNVAVDGVPARCGVVSSFGSAKVSVGSARFGVWARDRLARAVIDHVVSGWRRVGLQLMDRPVATDPEIVEFLVNRERVIFFDRCGLWEEDAPDGTKHDQVLEGILPFDRMKSLAQQWRVEVARELLQLGELTAAGWVEAVMTLTKLREPVFLRNVGVALDEGVERFAEGVVGRVSTSVAGVLARFGQPVAAGLVEALRLQCVAAVTQLRRQAEDARSAAGMDATAYVTAQLRQVGNHPVAAVSNFVAAALDQASGPGGHLAVAERLERAAVLLEQVVAKVLGPLRDELAKVGRDLQDKSFVEEFDGWPNDDGVSALYAPPPSEFCLVTLERWGPVLNGLLTQSPGSLEKARDLIGEGKFEYGPPGDRMVAPEAVRVAESRWWGRDGLPVDVTVALRPVEVVERARLWVGDRSAPLGKFVACGLSEYLDDRDDESGASVSDHRQRLDRFKEGLSRAVAMAKPLLSIDAGVMQRMHPGKELEVQVDVQHFPFGPGHPARTVVADVLAERQAFTGNNWAGVESVLLTSRLVAAVQPAVVSSLYEPIAAKWNRTIGHGGERRAAITEFWQYSRARLLTESIPLTQPAIEAITRGWYVGRMLGMISAPQGNTPMIVHWKDDRGGPTEHALPWPLLRDGYQLPALEDTKADWLPALFEHLGLAMMLWAGHPDILDGYEALHKIGINATKVLDNWVGTGEPPASGRTPQITGDDPAQRYAEMGEWIDKVIAQLDKRHKSAGHHAVADYAEFIQIPYGSELIDMTITQLEQLATSVSRPGQKRASA